MSSKKYNNPLVSVIIPAYNAENYVLESIHSILNQTYQNFECIIIDDASTDNTVHIITAIQDARIILIKKPVNTGYTKSLNIGLQKANGIYVARMDADDFSYPERFSRQVAFMEEHTDYIMCSTGFSLFHNNHAIPTSNTFDLLKIELLFTNVVCHPSVMMRTSALRTFQLEYNAKYEPAEDYELWTRMIRYGKIITLPSVLVKYRLHEGQVSSKRNKQQVRIANTIRKEYAAHLFRLFKGGWLTRLTPFWFAVVIFIESIANSNLNTYLAFRKVIRKRHKIFSH